jgi:hypothetical protein
MSPLKCSGICVLLIALAGCGVFAPEKSLLVNDNVDPPNPPPQGQFEANVISHIACEISNGLWKAAHQPDASHRLQWLTNYGAFVTLKLVVEDQSSLSPNASFITPLFNMQAFTLSIGGSGSANATRTETIQLTLSDGDLYAIAKKNRNAGNVDCKDWQNGVMIDSDLKIAQFIYDKAFVASTLVAPNKLTSTSPLSQIQFEINFVASYSGNVTPTWKFTRSTFNSNGTFLSAMRTDTDDVTITIGPLNADTRALHNAALTGSSTGLAIQSLAH